MSAEHRPMPGHIFQAMLDGRLDSHEAESRSREHWARITEGGTDMNERTRRRLAELSPGGRMERADATRDAKGRFAEQRKAEGADGKPSANDLLREALYGAGAYPEKKNEEGA